MKRARMEENQSDSVHSACRASNLALLELHTTTLHSRNMRKSASSTSNAHGQCTTCLPNAPKNDILQLARGAINGFVLALASASPRWSPSLS